MVRIPRFHRGEPGSIPGLGRLGAEIYYATVKDVGDIKGSQIQDLHGSTEYIKNYGPRARYMKGLVCINIWGVRLFISVSSVGRASVL